jgi:hypothetical protein
MHASSNKLHCTFISSYLPNSAPEYEALPALQQSGAQSQYPKTVVYLKGSRQRERRAVGNVSNGPNLSRTAAIDVLFSINSAVVFDFIHFRFRPSKAKSIGNIPLTNRQNAAKRVLEIC